jgi:hypothetical protein
MALSPSIAQASADASRGIFLGLGYGRMAEGRRQAPLSLTGDPLTVEAGLVIPGGSIFVYELGARAVSNFEDEGYFGRHVGRELSIFGGVRVNLLDDPGWLKLMPIIRAGMGLAFVRDRITQIQPVRAIGEDRVALGPHFAVGIERELWFGTALALFVDSHALVAPLVASLGLSVMMTSQSFL